jgi:predicted dehydrogenase
MKRPYRTLLVGCGSMSAAWLSPVRDYFSDRIEIVGLVDLNLESARKRASEFGLGGARTGVSLDAALAELKPDVLFNVTVPEAHYSTCKAALLAGADVLVEKPLAPTVAEARELLEASARTGKLLAVIQNRRYDGFIKAVREALRSGMIGRVHSIYADFFLAPRFGGFREVMRHPLLLDMAIHTFDQARFLTGLNALHATCHEFNPPGSWYAHGASAVATFELTGGAVFNYRGSWCAQGLQTSWESAWRIIGESGTLLWNGSDAMQVERVEGPPTSGEFIQPAKPAAVPPIETPPQCCGHSGLIGDFLDALDTGRPPQTIASDNIHSLAMVEAAVRSAESGCRIPLSS